MITSHGAMCDFRRSAGTKVGVPWERRVKETVFRGWILAQICGRGVGKCPSGCWAVCRTLRRVLTGVKKERDVQEAHR